MEGRGTREGGREGKGRGGEREGREEREGRGKGPSPLEKNSWRRHCCPLFGICSSLTTLSDVIW